MALLVQNSEGNWIYYSFNGVDCSAGDRQIHDKGVDGGWKSPQEFLNSGYNRKANTKKGEKHDSDAYCDYNYAKAYVIETSKEQDKAIINTFESCIDEKSYNLVACNCAIVTQMSLESGSVVDYESYSYYMPSSAYYSPCSSWGNVNPGYDTIIMTYRYKIHPYFAYKYIKSHINGVEVKKSKKIK